MSELKFSVKKTLIVGFGFLGISLIWSAYNAYVPIFLKETFHIQSKFIGMIMSIDNVFQIVLLPYLGALSDRTHTRFGRRKPYILVGTPLAAIFFVLIPVANAAQSLSLMMGAVILMNFSMAIFRSPAIALMPDVTPSKFRSQANGLINLMGGLGALLAYFGSEPLYNTNPSYPFFAGAGVLMMASAVVIFFVREPKSIKVESADEGDTLSSVDELKQNLREIFKSEKSLLLILLAVFFWFIGFNAIETFFTSYAKYHLGIAESAGARIIGIFSLTYMITAVPAGMIGGRLGRKTTITFGLGLLITMMLLVLFVNQTALVSLLFAFSGFGWALINVNSFPMVVDMTDDNQVGGFTGLYYFFAQAGSIIAPVFAGWIIDIMGYGSLMGICASFFIVALAAISGVKRGEAKEK